MKYNLKFKITTTKYSARIKKRCFLTGSSQGMEKSPFNTHACLCAMLTGKKLHGLVSWFSSQ